MSQVYASNLDGLTAGAAIPGFTALSGVFVAQDSAGGARPVSGTKASLTQAAEGNTALYTAAGALLNEDWQSSFKVLVNSGDSPVNHHILRADATYANGYRVALLYSSGQYTAVLTKKISGATTNLGSGSGTPTPLTVANGDTVYMATTISGTNPATINLYLWKSGSRPATPNYTWTDSAITAAGYPGFYAALGTQGSAPSSDDFVLDDMQAAGGGATVNLTGANSTQGSTSSTGAATVTAAGTTSTIVSAVFRGFGGLPLKSLTVPNVMVIGLNRAVLLSLANQTTDATNGQMTIPGVPVAAGTSCMLATFNADGSARGLEKVTTQ